MKRAFVMLTRTMVLLLTVSAWGESARPPKLDKPKEGFGRYVLVLWEPGTPVPGDEKKHMPKMTEPDYGELGATLLITNANWRGGPAGQGGQETREASGRGLDAASVDGRALC